MQQLLWSSKLFFFPQFDELCSKHIEEVEINPEANIEVEKFKKGPLMAAVITRVSQRLGVRLRFSKL